jgi:hypothetical protein
VWSNHLESHVEVWESTNVVVEFEFSSGSREVNDVSIWEVVLVRVGVAQVEILD